MKKIDLLRLMYSDVSEWEIYNRYGMDGLKTVQHNSGWYFYHGWFAVIFYREGNRAVHIGLLWWLFAFAISATLLERRIEKHLATNGSTNN